MNNRKKKASLQQQIKHFTLSATATAILALQCESARAQSCDPFITGTSFANVICDFDSTTGSSVTVENAGQVQGIVMPSYNAPPPSFIAINSGGIINNNTGTGIHLNAAALSNGISNSGTITTHGVGIFISNASDINGGISNSGAINSTGTGILASSTSIINGGISNSGTIEIGGNFAGIAIEDNSSINGDFTNSGLIETNLGDALLFRAGSYLNGSISNDGVINSISHTSITVMNTSHIYGSISNRGTINAARNGVSVHNIGTVNGSILNSGTISGGDKGITVFSESIVNGSISNSGTIRGGNTGIAILSSSLVNGGLSNSGTIQGDVYAISVDASSTLGDFDILGQNARVIGAVDASGTRVNITSGATFTSEGSYHVDRFNISSNAFFNMANTIEALTVNNAGTLAIHNTLQTILGDYTQQTGGVFQTGVSDTTHYGQLSVAGTLDLAQSGQVYVNLAQQASIKNGDVLTDVLSGITLSAPIDNFQVNDNSYIWQFIPSLNQSNNGLNLTASINPDAYNACRGSYCQGAATTIVEQIAAGNLLFSPYTTLESADALRIAASQATPELTNENRQMAQLISRAVLDVVPMWQTLRGQSAGDAMIYQPGKVWIKPYGASMTQNQHNTVQGFDANAYGAVIGKDIQLGHDGLFGAALSAGGDHMQGKSVLNGQSINSNSYQGILYGSTILPHQFYVAGQGLLGYQNNDTSRAIPLYTTTAKGSYDSWFTNLRVEGGWRTDALYPNLVFTPEVDMSYLFINQDRYQESGSPMSLLVASNHNASLIVGAYGNVAYHLLALNDQHNLTVTGYAGVAGDVLNNQPQTLSTFVASSSSFTTFGVQFNEIVFRGGAGLLLTNPTKPVTLELNYDLQAGNNAYSQIGVATIKYRMA